MPGFKDHFSGHAADYAKYRPHYPPELFAYLSSLTAEHGCAWDCGTGNGQAAVALAEYYQHVVATDPSAQQLAEATPHPKVVYHCAQAEHSGIATHTLDLITVAQAAHWFGLEAFYAEVRRVGKPGGVIALWSYELMRVSSAIDPILRDYLDNVVGPYWPPERRWVSELYHTLPFPFPEVEAPRFEMKAVWTLEETLAYLSTWSATKRAIQATGANPLVPLREKLLRLWQPDEPKPIVWELNLRIGRVPEGN